MSCCVFWWRLYVTCLTVLLAKHGDWKDLCFGKFVAILHIPSMWPWRLLTPKSGAHCLLLPMDPRTEWRLDIRIQGSGNEFDLSWTSFVSNTSTSIAPCCWLWQEHWKLDCCRSCPSSSGSKPLGVILSSEFVVVFQVRRTDLLCIGVPGCSLQHLIASASWEAQKWKLFSWTGSCQ
jgi:hypothetical protein